MSSDPERPIEKLLRDCGRQRREQAGDTWELPPASRRQLQQEVARRFSRSEKTSSWWQRNWFSAPWWAVAVSGAAAVLILAAGLWFGAPRHSAEKNSTLFAKNEQPPAPPANDKLSSFDTKGREEEA